MGEHCIFCRIAAGDEPASIVYEDGMTLAFMDINPVTRGHTLVIPREHVATIYEASAAQAAALMIAGAKIARALKASLQCAGVNLYMANERAAGQEVMHAHLHVIPRYSGDGFGIHRGPIRERSDRQYLEGIAEMIRAHLER